MKAYFLALLVVACGAITRARAAQCANDEDCARRECCVKVASPYIGRCTPRGRLGAACLPNEDVDEKHQPKCPCLPGMICKPTSTVHTEVGDIPQNHRCFINATMLAPGVKIGPVTGVMKTAMKTFKLPQNHPKRRMS